MSIIELLCSAYVALALPNADVACYHMDTVVESAEEYNIDPAVMVSLIFVESRWKASAVSRDGACGLTQVLPRYSGGTRNRFGEKLTCKQLQNPVTSIQRGTRILNYHLRRYRKSYKRSLCAYNAGGSRCRRDSRQNKGHRYARKVLRLSRLLKRRVKRIEREEREMEEIPGCYE